MTVSIKKIAILGFLLYCTGLNAQWKEITNNFRTIPEKVRPNPLWFWNDSKVEKDELIRQMANHKKSGYGGLSILPFGKNFKPEYLSEDYFDTYRVCIEEAEKLGLSLWIYDEYGFPSGTAGDINGDGFGRFKHKYPEHTTKRLDKTEYIPKARSKFTQALPNELLMGVVAMDTVSFKRIDLSKYISGNTLNWNVPAGNWKVMVFTCVNDGNTVVDYMSPEAVNLYIGMTHEQYYKHFGKYFGKTIKGTFFDEPTLYYAQGRSWTPKFNEKFEKEYGINPALYYPALWYDIGSETEEARNYLFGFRARLYTEGYTKLISDWSKAHGVLATGHQDNEEVINPVGTSGDFMKCFQYLEVPGIDKIGGNRPAEKFYKIVSSAAHNWDHSLVMSETYGDRGNIGWEEIYSIAMDQYAKGINLLIPHAVWYNTEKVVFKPELSYRSPIYADGLNAFNDYLSRLNALMQNDGRWEGDVAILYPIHTLQSGHYMDGPLGHYAGGVEIPDMDYVDVGVNLFDSLGYDHMFIHPEVLDGQCLVSKGKLKLNNKTQYNDFSVMVVPSAKTISLSNLEKIKRFADAGGKVVFTTQLPQNATLEKDNQKVTKIIGEMFPKESRTTAYGKISGEGNIYFVKEPTVANLESIFDGLQENFTLKFKSKDRVRNIHKILDKKNIWFLANPESKAKNVEFALAGKFDLKVWNPHTGDIKKLDNVKYINGKTEIKLEMEGCHSLFLVEE